MAKQFRNTVLTNQGFAVSNKASLGKTKFEITRAVATDENLSGYKTEDLKNLTDLTGNKVNGIFKDYDMPADGVSAIKIDFNNSEKTSGYTINAVGIYAKEEGGEEFLHSITVTDTPVIIPEVNGTVYDGFHLTVAIFSGDNKNITIHLADETTATIKYVNDKIAGIDLSSAVKDAKYYTDSKVDGLNIGQYAKSSDVDNKIAGLNVGQYAKATDVDSKISNIDLSKPETNANNYTDGKVNEIKSTTEDYTGVKNFKNGIKVSDKSIYVQDDKLMYENKPVLIANAPNAPTVDLSINRDTGTLDYQITPPSIDGGASVTSYKVFYKKTSESNFKYFQVDTNDLFGSIDAEKGIEYELFVKAVNFAGESYDGISKKILTATEPRAVNINLSSDFPDGINYNIDVLDDGNSNVTGYQILYKKDNEVNWNLIDNLSDKNGKFTVNDMGNYQVKAKAINVVGISKNDNYSSINYEDNIIYEMHYTQGNGNTENLDNPQKIGKLNNINQDNFQQKNATIWSDIKEITRYNGDPMIRFPKFYLKRTKNGNNVTFQISRKYFEGCELLPCFYDYDNNRELDYVDVFKLNINNFGNLSTNNRITSNFSTNIDSSTVILNQTTKDFKTGGYLCNLDWSLLEMLCISHSFLYGNGLVGSNLYKDIKGYFGLQIVVDDLNRGLSQQNSSGEMMFISNISFSLINGYYQPVLKNYYKSAYPSANDPIIFSHIFPFAPYSYHYNGYTYFANGGFIIWGNSSPVHMYMKGE